VVIVTPFVVRSVAQKLLSRPDDGFADPSDPQTVLLGRLNRIYGTAGKPAALPSRAPTLTANTDSFSIERHQGTSDEQNSRRRLPGAAPKAALHLVAAGVSQPCWPACNQTKVSQSDYPTTIGCVIRSHWRKVTHP